MDSQSFHLCMKDQCLNDQILEAIMLIDIIYKWIYLLDGNVENIMVHKRNHFTNKHIMVMMALELD